MGVRNGFPTRRFQASIAVLLIGSACRFHGSLPLLMLSSDDAPNNAKLTRVINTTNLIPAWNKTKSSTPTFNQNDTFDDAFNAQNLEWSKRKVPCGSQKCLYRIKSKSDPQIAYLVATEQHSSGYGKRLESAWQQAQQLERDYKIKHFLLGPPQQVKVSKDLARRLRHNLYVEKHRQMLKGKELWQRYPKGSTVHVQKVRIAPKNHLLLGCVDSKINAFQQDWPRFSSLVKFKQSFATNFQNGLEETKLLLKMEPCLFKDFQVMVDTRGDLYHLDFDRCFRSSGKKWHMPSNFTASCLDSLDTINQDIQGILVNNTMSTLE